MAQGRTYDFIVTLKPAANTAAFDWISHLLLFFAVAASTYFTIFIYYQDSAGRVFFDLPAESNTAKVLGMAFTVLILGAWIYSTIRKKPFRWGLFISAVAWIYFGKYIIGILYIIAGLLEKQVNFPAEIGFDREGITINSFPRKSYAWAEVNNVVMRDDILTVDLKNNKIIQKQVADEVSGETEKEFNEFCRYRLSAATGGAAV